MGLELGAGGSQGWTEFWDHSQKDEDLGMGELSREYMWGEDRVGQRQNPGPSHRAVASGGRLV